MRVAQVVPTLGAILLAAGLALGGTAPVGRLALELGLPGVAVGLLDDPHLRAVALHRSGRYAEASDAFGAAGDPYNRGVSAALAGDYATALLAWDTVLAANPSDRQARANHTLVKALLATVTFDAVARPEDRPRDGPTLEAEPGQGKARAAGQGDEATDPKTGFWMPEVVSSGLRRVPKIFDAQATAASERWLTTLEDQPGVYLAARLAAEQKAREAAGTALPPPEDPQ